jgi:hypothetical protein
MSDYLGKLPGNCDNYGLIDLQSITKMDEQTELKQVFTENPEMKKWADTITPSHVAGIAQAANMIIEENSITDLEFSMMGTFLRLLAESHNGNKKAFNKSAGITLGIYNTLVMMVEEHQPRVLEQIEEECNNLFDKDVAYLPARCRVSKIYD